MGQLPQIRPNPVKILAGAGFGQKRAGCQICRSQSRNPVHPYLTLLLGDFMCFMSYMTADFVPFVHDEVSICLIIK